MLSYEKISHLWLPPTVSYSPKPRPMQSFHITHNMGNLQIIQFVPAFMNLECFTHQSFRAKLLMATSSRRTVTSTINSLVNDGIVWLTTQDYAQYEALVSDYFDRDDETSDDKIIKQWRRMW